MILIRTKITTVLNFELDIKDLDTDKNKIQNIINKTIIEELFKDEYNAITIDKDKNYFKLLSIDSEAKILEDKKAAAKKKPNNKKKKKKKTK